MSIGGNVNEEQRKIIKSAIGKMPEVSKIISGYDRDKDGEKYHKMVKDLAPDADIIRDRPIAKDWNKQRTDKLQ